ncbi:MAG: hypothetical protein QOI82_2008 [Actinomycetota bacterium]|jgi:hypothetical protein|nr:hypothetical protein [Actinomycetota bacterium]
MVVMASRRTNTVLITLFGVLAATSIVVTGVFDKLLAGDPRVLVVTMKQDAGESSRDVLKRDCGSLPGISVVADKGNPDPAIQGRFPVRFSLANTTPAQEAALESCIDRHHDLVRGILTEGDR